jgi:signal peptidase II
MHAIFLLLSAGIVTAFDQLAKRLVVAHPSAQPIASVAGVELRRIIYHSGRASPRYWIMLLLVQAIWLCGMVELLPLLQHHVVTIGLGAALGGAVSNVLDRVWRGGVLDYIDVGFWPVFNIADAAIVLVGGAALLALCSRWLEAGIG